MASEEKKQLTYYHKQRIQLADELLLMISTIIAYLELAYTESPPKIESPPPDADRGKELYAAREVWSLGDVIASAQDLGLGEDNTDLKNIEWRRCRLDFLKLLESYKSTPSRVMRPWSRCRSNKIIECNDKAITIARRLEGLISAQQNQFRDPSTTVTALPKFRRPNPADRHYSGKRPYSVMRDLLRSNHDPYIPVYHSATTGFHQIPDIDDAYFGLISPLSSPTCEVH